MLRLNLVLTLILMMSFTVMAVANAVNYCGLYANVGTSVLCLSVVQELLDDVVRGFPRESLKISGDITVRKQRGVITREMEFEMRLDWGGNPASAEYTIRDAFGSNLEKMTVIRAENGSVTFKYASGKDLTSAACPNIGEMIQGTDMSWMDLTLGFLWWKGGSLIGQEFVRGRECHIVEIPAPANDQGPYGKVMLWIDQRLHVILQVEGYGHDGEKIRRLWVNGFKKIDDRWMIKDMEIENFPVIRRTKMRIREVGVDTRS
ncbi:MAG: outer membrane lipoprotein-sorting protein [Lentisphaerae bacterium]|nr:outer membrane lipoprotein-sorting protein [Lentisphaerota bacterium]